MDYRFEVRDDGWWMTEPVLDRADGAILAELMSLTRRSQVLLTIENPESLDAYGLSPARMTVRVEGPDGTAQPGTSIPPGARFHLQVMNLSEEDAKRLGGAIMSFSYSQDGRRRTSIMYLKQAALNGAPAGPQ